MLDIRWEEGFEAALAQAVPDPEVRATLCERVEWVLACRAEAASEAVPGTTCRAHHAGSIGVFPGVRILFRIEGEVVALIHATREKPGLPSGLTAAG
jgi:hypothetical protein